MEVLWPFPASSLRPSFSGRAMVSWLAGLSGVAVSAGSPIVMVRGDRSFSEGDIGRPPRVLICSVSGVDLATMAPVGLPCSTRCDRHFDVRWIDISTQGRSELVAVELAFPPRHHNRGHAVAGEVH